MRRTYQSHRTSKINVKNLALNLGNGVQLDVALEGFLESRRGLSAETVSFYTEKLTPFIHWLKDECGITTVEDINVHTVQDYLAERERRGSNAGGQHASFRSIRAFLSWMEEVTDYEYQSPVKRVRPPKVQVTPIPGVEIDDVQKMIKACDGAMAARDKAVLLTLLDTGARVGEFLALTVEDVNFTTGEVVIQHGKGDKRRSVFLGVKTRRALRDYLRTRENLNPYDPLFASDEGLRMTYSTVRQILRRRAEDARVDPPYPHDFRRAFALTLWRNGTDIVTISRLMGHSALEVLKRYLAQDTADLARAHAKASPVDTKLR